MSPELQRIAIAQACGWRLWNHPDCMAKKEGWSMPEKWCMRASGELAFNHDIPDYLSDLNAMHEAEKTLGVVGRSDYYGHLVDMMDRNPDGSHRYGAVTYWEVTTATAAQRAEALLRTIGKWKEDA